MPAGAPEQQPWPVTLASALGSFVQAQFLPLALMTALAVGYLYPEAGVAARGMNVPAISTTGIFIVQGLSLRRKEAMQALKSGGGG